MARKKKAMKKETHFVGFEPYSERYWRAARIFGQPSFMHRVWDQRAVVEVMPGDVVIFAKGDEYQPVSG